MSIHFWKSRELAARKGAAFGACTTDQAAAFCEMSKRELIEVALRLAALCEGDEAATFDGRAFKRVVDEHAALKQAGII